MPQLPAADAGDPAHPVMNRSVAAATAMLTPSVFTRGSDAQGMATS
ncbi:hypothetical protein ACFPRL_15505 [Pseudoclavibacter helvolus]